MSDATELGELYQQLLAISTRAFAGEHYHVAYYALGGALQTAIDLESDIHLAAVEQLLGEQLSQFTANGGDELVDDSAMLRLGLANSFTAQLRQIANLRGVLRKKQRRSAG